MVSTQDIALSNFSVFYVDFLTKEAICTEKYFARLFSKATDMINGVFKCYFLSKKGNQPRLVIRMCPITEGVNRDNTG